jgi:hypothetical protein
MTYANNNEMNNGLPGTGVRRIDFPGGFATAKVDGLRRD